MIYPEADLVLGKAVRCQACGSATVAVSYDRPSGTVKTKCSCEGLHFQNLIQPAPATATA